MPYSIKYSPLAYSSAHDDLIYTVLDPEKISDPDTYANFKYIGDIYIGGNLIARLKKIPDPTTGIGIFNISQIVRNYLNMTLDPVAGLVRCQEAGDSEWTVSVVMKFGEEWNYTPTYDLLTDSSRTFFNNYNGRLIGVTSSLISRTNKVISNRPFAGQVLAGSSYYFIPYFPTSGSAVTFQVTPVGGGSGFSTTFTPSGANILQLLNVAPGALNSAHAGTITATTTSYIVQIGSQVYSFDLVCEPIYVPYTLHFMNQYGGFDSVLFGKASKKSYDIERKTYGRLPYTIGSDGVPQYITANKVRNETTATYSSHFKEKLSLNTDILSDEQYVWLGDLMKSPLVYIEDSGEFFSIQITETNYEQKRNSIDDMTNLTIGVTFGNQLNAQYR